MSEPEVFSITLRNGVNRNKSGHHLRDIVKSEYLGQRYYFGSRTDRLRFVMSAFVDGVVIDKQYAKIITRLLHDQSFSRAEVHAVLFRLGFRYKITQPSYNHDIRNLQVDGYIVPRKVGRPKFSES